MGGIEYLRPGSIAEASEVMRGFEGEAKLIAGGTDLLVQMRNKLKQPRYLVDVGFIPELQGISLDGNEVIIGAATKIAEIESSHLVQNQLPVLVQAARVLASHQVRYLATLGGNVCNAAPSADTAPALIALGAKALIYSRHGLKTVLMEDFFVGPGLTVLEHDELLTGVSIPLPSKSSDHVYLKHTLRRSMDIALVGVAVKIEQENGICTDARIVLGAVAPTPIRVRRAEAILTGSLLDQDDINKAAETASLSCEPITDVRCCSQYRRQMVRVLTIRALTLLKRGGMKN